MNRCFYCNKRIWLSKDWCIKCLKKEVAKLDEKKKNIKLTEENEK